MGIGEPGIDVLAETRFLEIGQCLPVAPLINFDGDQFTSRFAKRPCDSDRGMSRRGSHFHRLLVFILDDYFIENLSVRLRNVKILPPVSHFIEEFLHFLVDGSILFRSL